MQTQNKKLQDNGSLAHMIAWRDRKIAMLQDMLEGARQKDAIYAAYVTYLLSRLGKGEEAEQTLRIAKADIRALCGRYEIEAEDGGEDFLIILRSKGEEAEPNGTRCGEVADA